MKKLTAWTATVVLSISAYAQQPVKSIEVGEALPMADVKMKAVGDKQVSLDGEKTANGLIVMFSCNTCPYVVKSQARTQEIMAYARERKLGMVIINSNEAKRDGEDSYKAMTKYAKEQGYTVPYVVDDRSALADAFGATRTPEVFLFDGRGVLMYKGAMEDNPASPAESTKFFLRDAIDRIMAGALPEPASTKSIGCSIKRAS